MSLMPTRDPEIRGHVGVIGHGETEGVATAQLLFGEQG